MIDTIAVLFHPFYIGMIVCVRYRVYVCVYVVCDCVCGNDVCRFALL